MLPGFRAKARMVSVCGGSIGTMTRRTSSGPSPMPQPNTSPRIPCDRTSRAQTASASATPNSSPGTSPSPPGGAGRPSSPTVGGRSPLVHFVDTPRTRIELSTTHPGGLPQFITGKSTLLSSLIRDELALRNARLAAAEITQKGIELRSVRGIESVHLAIGLASWRNAGEEYLAPVLLRPLAIRRYGRDFELKLKGQPFLNPALARELREQFQITLDADAFVALAITNGVFKPQPVIDRLRGLTSHLPWFNVAPRLVVSSFAEVGPAHGRATPADLDHPAHRRDRRQPGRSRRASRSRASAARPVGAGRATAVDRHAAARRRPRAGEGRRRDRVRHLARREDPAGHRRHPDDRERDRRARRAATSACSSSARAARASTASPTASDRSASAARPSAPPGCAATSSSRSRATRRSSSRGSPTSTTPSCACARCCSTTVRRSRGATPNCTSRCSTPWASSPASRSCRRRRRRPPASTTPRSSRSPTGRDRVARDLARAADARRVPLRAGRLALVRRVLHLVRGGHRTRTSSRSG